MNRYLLAISVLLLGISASGCVSPNLSSLEQLSPQQQYALLQRMHISRLCGYYLDPELEGETERIIVGLLRARGVTNCSSDGIEKGVPSG